MVTSTAKDTTSPTVATTKKPRLELPDQEGGSGTIFGWCVSMTNGGEADLTRDHYAKKQSIFACESWSVFADGALDPIPVTQLGGFNSKWAPWGSFYNTQVFLRAWDALFKEGKWKSQGWTVKVDPDTVWFPHKLKWHLKGTHSLDKFLWRNTGKMMLGPIEVFSVATVKDMSERMRETCKWGIDVSGEDGWIDACMGTLGITKKYDGQLLQSTGGNPGFCGNHYIVAFHPFKNTGSYAACYGKSA